MAPGFDNTIWRLGEELVVRLPRRRIAVPLIESEQRWLPEMALRLPLLIPTPIRVGRPSEVFPWPWTIAKWIEGTPGNEVAPRLLRAAATPLGHFLRALHVDAPADAPTNAFRSVPLRSHEASFLERLEQIDTSFNRDDLLAIWRASLNADARAGAPQWIHGDPHPANLIFDGEQLVGVIDFGDICAGDPATDLAAGILALPHESLDEFFRAYGAVDDATLRRTLGWAVHFGLMFVLLGESDEPTYAPIGARAIENAITFSRALA
jgi:aminoglycoside phosphotransferase (APT) family kinase protein